MNTFKRLALTLMSCCVMLSGCGRANESEDSAPDGIVEITPTTQAEDEYEENDDYDYNDIRTAVTTAYTPDFSFTTTTLAKRRGNVYVASASPAPKTVKTVTTVYKGTAKALRTQTTVSGTSRKTVRTTAATDIAQTVTTSAAVSSTAVHTTTTTVRQTAPATTTTAPVTTYQGLSPEEQLSKLTLRQKVSQMFIVSPDQLSGVKNSVSANTTMKRTLADTPAGGIIFSEDNLTSKKQLAALLINISGYLDQSCGIGAVTAVCEEGGEASPVSKKLLTSGFYEPAVYGNENDPEHVYSIGKTMGSELSSLGFRLNLAPPADISSGYSSDEHITADLVTSMIRGLKESGVYAAAGNFPGTEMRSGRTLKQLRAVEFLPYKAAVDEGVSFISMGHQRVSGFGDSLPADLSQKAVGCLRNELGFNGVIISGNMSDEVITENYTSGEAASASIKAGADMILLPADFTEAVDAVCAAVENGEISEERINESVLRVLTIKKAMELY